MTTRVMLVDDSAAVRSIARVALSDAGFECIEARDGVDALEKLEQMDVALVICDVNMPRMSGVELIEEIAGRTTRKNPPFIMLTTEGNPDLVKRAKAHGAIGWMVKPFKPALLVAAVKKVLERCAA